MAEASDTEYLRRAIDLAVEAARRGGGPFGAVIVREGRVIGEGGNSVVASHDPTAHAEVVAIRAACRELASHDLAGATVYASCEPCPMCLGALYWARVDRVLYASDRKDAARAGFADERIYEELALPPGARTLAMSQLLDDEGAKAFRAWEANSGRRTY